jgi:LL-H family phage holin
MTEKLVYEVLFALVVAIAGIVAKTLIPYLKQKEAEALAKLRQTQWAWAADIIEAVVRAVEQTVSEEIHGEDKKAIAVRYITDIFRQNGINLSHEQIDKLIEAAVQAMNQQSIQIEVPDETVEE